MKRRVQWSLGLAFLVAAGLGCGRQDSPRSIEISVPPPATPEGPALPSPTSPSDNAPPPSPEQTPAPSPTPAPEQTPAPSPSPIPSTEPVSAADWWKVYPEPAPMPSEVPACVPRGAPTGVRFAHPCTVKKFAQPWDTEAKALQRWDAQGHLLEDAEGPLADGTWGQRSLCTYAAHTVSCELTEMGRHASSVTTYDDQGHKVRMEAHGSTSQWSGTRLDEWTYDEAGQVVRHTFGTPDPSSEERMTYDDLGRLASSAFYSVGSDGVRWLYYRLGYRYGQQGWLLGIGISTDEDGSPQYGSPYRTFTYHPNGQLKSRYEDMGPYSACGGCFRSVEFDDQGRETLEHLQGDEFHWTEAWTFPNQGRDAEMILDGDGSQGTHHAWYSQRRDDAGRVVLERQIFDSLPLDTLTPQRHLSFNRSTYACTTGELLQHEEDRDGDGRRDGLHELQWDAAGNLQLERFSGSLIDVVNPYSRVEYDYSCLR